MGFFSRIFSRRSAPPQSGLSGLYSAPPAFVSRDIALNATVQACSNFYAAAISILPLNLYRRKPDGSRERATDHPLYRVMKAQPNPDQTPVAFMSRLVRDILEKGNAYLWKTEAPARKGSFSKVAALSRLVPDGVKERYAPGQTTYTYGEKTYDARQILRITSLVTDDYGKGISPLVFAKTAVQLGIQLDEYAFSAFGNGLNTKLLIDATEGTQSIKDEKEAANYARNLAEYVRAQYTGAENAGKPLVQFRGWKAAEIKGQSSNKDGELLESRRWQELEICKILGVPPFLVNGSYDIKYGNFSDAMTVVLNFTLSPYLKHLEASFNSLLDEDERETYYFEFDFSALLRPDEKSRMESYWKLFQMGAISPGMICAKENLDAPKEGADARFILANLMPLDNEILKAYMAGAKLKAEKLGSGGDIGAKSEPDPARAAGDDKQ